MLRLQFFKLFSRFIIRTVKPKEKSLETPSTPSTSKPFCPPSRPSSSASSAITHITDTESESDELDYNSENEEKQPPKKKKRSYKQKFKDSWIEQLGGEGDWLTHTKYQEPFCKVCQKLLKGGITHIKRHCSTVMHKKNFRAAKMTPKVDKSFFLNSHKKLSEQVRTAEILLIMFLAEHNLPFLLLDHLTKLLPVLCPDSEIAKHIHCGRKKGTNLCVNLIGPTQISMLAKELNNSFFSLIVDEMTDVSVCKTLAVVVRYYQNSVEKVCDRFLGLVEVEKGSAESLFNSIIELLNNYKIKIENMIGFAADNASVMMGKKNGLQAKFKQIIPHVFVMGCVCHSFNLCSSAACKMLPSSVEEFCRDVCNYFSHSSNRLKDLKKCQMFAKIEPHKMLKLSQTRWLSLQMVVNRILEQWNALLLFFTSEVSENDDANIGHARHILEALKNPVFKLYLLYLKYVLDIVNRLNLEFQSEDLKLHVLQSRISTLVRTLIRNYVKKEHLLDDLDKTNFSNPRVFLKLEEIYYGAEVEQFILKTEINRNDLLGFRTKCLNFYIELVKQIQNRFTFSDDVFECAKILDPKVVYSDKVNSVVKHANLFPVLVEELETLNTEWRMLQDNMDMRKYIDESPTAFWNKVFKMRNDLDALMFPNLKRLITGYMSLPHSSAAAERIFSQANLVKSKLRNSLLTVTESSLLHTKEMLNKNPCYNFKPFKNLINANVDNKENEGLEDLTF